MSGCDGAKKAATGLSRRALTGVRSEFVGQRDAEGARRIEDTVAGIEGRAVVRRRHHMVLVEHILYPEGERSIDGTPKTFKKGAAILSIHMQVPIVPVAIEGFYKAWPRNKPFQGFTPLKMVFGDPIVPPPESEASEAAYDKLTAELKSRVIGMWEDLRK